ncbi:MAG TPA: DUF3857 domain-containing protein [Chitinophagaceae bacterium]|nr:DUF3857 domain-containing protein [Chitinophagaceae bacterium]
MRTYSFFFSFILLVTLKLPAQSTLPQFGSYTSEEIGMKECLFEKEANAVVLLDEAFSNYDDDWALVTSRRVRIKILNEKGVDRGNITIPFYSKDKFEFIRNIKGITFNSNQTPELSDLDRKSIFTEKVDEWKSRVKFAMPNVKAGSIIEYQYESVMKHYGGLDRWIFQADIPTLKSCYLLQIIPNHEFSYVVTKKNNYDVVITPKPDLGQIYFEMNNIPGLRFEPFMDAPKDYFQQVEFQLSGYQTYGHNQAVNTSWQNIANDLSSDKALGGSLKKDPPKIDDLKAMEDKESNTIRKINVAYNYVKDNFTWDGYDSKYATDGLKKVWDKKNGTSGEINLVLISLLQSFGIDAEPMLVADRDFGKVDPKLPFIDRFNKTVAYVTADGNSFILDATQKYCPIGLVPYPLLNTYALIINRKTTGPMVIKSGNGSYLSTISIHGALANTGLLSAESVIRSDQYAKQSQSEQIVDNEKDFIRDYEKDNQGISIDSFSYADLKNEDSSLIQNINFNEQFDKTGDFVLLNYNLFTGLSKNLFTKDERFTNVDFGYPYHVTVEETIELPENSRIEGKPADMKITAPDGDISVSRQIIQTGKDLKIKIEFLQSVTLVSYDDYSYLKNFYKQIVTMLNEPITVKLAK